MDHSLHKIGVTLGKLETQIITLSEAMQEAKKSRQENYQKLDNISRHLYDAKCDIVNLEGRIANVEKPMKQLQKWQERGLGAIMLMCGCGVLIGEAATSFLNKLLTIIQ